MSIMTDWLTWHQHYDDPGSSLARRLQVVQRHLSDLVDHAACRKILSLCAGDGRDLIPVIARLPRERRPEVVMVELDESLAGAAKARAQAMDVDVTVVAADAGAAAAWRDHLPVDLLMLCGIFGNISVADIKTTVAASRCMVSPSGVVVWTRGATAEEDLRPQIRQWFRAAGFSELAFEADPESYGVGVNRRADVGASDRLPEQLFTFQR